MLKKTLFHELTGADIRAKGVRPTPITPDTVSHFFIKSGYVMEYFRIGREAKKVVSLFFGPGEYALPSHIDFSTFVGIEDAALVRLTHGSVIRTLRKFPETARLYRGVQQEYEKKVADRLQSLAMTAPERFAHLKKTQAWVLEFVEEEDIANYLRVSVGMLQSLRKGR